ncbi:MAG: hypothetical protein IKS87_06525 [Lachnospiraceae bacterium]|nr:hypothetical protein [Lachnospiraceae bacterium]
MKRTGFPTQAMLTIRVVVGGYVLYLAYTLIRDRETSTMPSWALILSLIVFIAGGVGVIAHSAYLYFKGMYAGGKADTGSDEDGTDVNTEASETQADVKAIEAAGTEADVNAVEAGGNRADTEDVTGED